jgi:hypothetical protein
MKYCFALLLVLGGINSFAQNNGLTNNQIGQHVSNCIWNNYSPDSVALKKTCRRACIFIKFNIDKQGRVANLSFSKDSTVFITEGLTKAVKHLEKDKQLINTLTRSGRTIIQPFIYDYQLACNFPDDYTLSMPEEEKAKRNLEYYRIRDESEHYSETIFDIMNFHGDKLIAIDCILLAPIRMGAAIMY